MLWRVLTEAGEAGPDLYKGNAIFTLTCERNKNREIRHSTKFG